MKVIYHIEFYHFVKRGILNFIILVSTAVWVFFLDLCVYLNLEVPYIRQRKPLVSDFWPVPQRQTVRQSFEVRTKLPKHRRVFTTNTETRVLIANLIHLIRHKQTRSIALFLRLCNEIQQTSAAQTAFAIKQPLFGYRYCALSCWASVCLSIFAALLISFVIHRISFDFLIPSYFLLKRCIYNLPHKLGGFQENNLEFTKCSHGLLRNCNSLKKLFGLFS